MHGMFNIVHPTGVGMIRDGLTPQEALMSSSHRCGNDSVDKYLRTDTK